MRVTRAHKIDRSPRTGPVDLFSSSFARAPRYPKALEGYGNWQPGGLENR